MRGSVPGGFGRSETPRMSCCCPCSIASAHSLHAKKWNSNSSASAGVSSPKRSRSAACVATSQRTTRRQQSTSDSQRCGVWPMRLPMPAYSARTSLQAYAASKVPKKTRNSCRQLAHCRTGPGSPINLGSGIPSWEVRLCHGRRPSWVWPATRRVGCRKSSRPPTTGRPLGRCQSDREGWSH